jgi:tetratricopeptide (TPR) repeat protein
MIHPKKKLFGAGIAIPLLCGALWFGSAKWGDLTATAQRARQGGGAIGDPANAQQMEARLRSNPGDAYAHQSLEFYYRYKARDLDKALFHGREAVRLDPKNALAKWDLGQTLIRAGQRDEAMRTFEQMASAPVEGRGLARKFAEEDVETGRKWLRLMKEKPKLGLTRAAQG